MFHSPTRSGRKRVFPQAPSPRHQNVAHLVHEREGNASSSRTIASSMRAVPFRNMRHLVELDPLAQPGKWKQAPRRKRGYVLEMVNAPTHHILGVLTEPGLCAMYDTRTFTLLCYLNASADDFVRSFYYNKASNAFITVSVHRHDMNFSALRCRSVPVEWVRRGQPEKGFPLFDGRHILYPGFVEFDDANGIVITYNPSAHEYRVWDLADYRPLYRIQDPNIEEIKVAPSLMLIVYKRESSHVLLKIGDVRTGRVVKALRHLLKRKRAIAFVEHFHDHLLIKQVGEPLQIIDLRTNVVVEMADTQFMKSTSFLFLYESHIFLTFHAKYSCIWDFRGQLITRMRDVHAKLDQSSHVSITEAQDLLLAYNENNGDSYVTVIDVLTGRRIASVDPHTMYDSNGRPGPQRGEAKRARVGAEYARWGSSGSGGDTPGVDAATAARRRLFKGVTALLYDEESGYLFLGNQFGRVQVLGH